MGRESKREMVAFYNKRNYHLLVNRHVRSDERITCVLRDKESKKSLKKRISLGWGGMNAADRANVRKIPTNSSWANASKIEITLSPLAYGVFLTNGSVSANYSAGNIHLEKVDNLEAYL
jgi:hypothetical protein